MTHRRRIVYAILSHPSRTPRRAPPPPARHPRVPWCGPIAVRTPRAPWSGPVAVGRDVPIAPPRLGAVRGLASRIPLAPLAVRHRHHAPWCARAPPPPARPVAASYATSHSYYPCGAMGTSRPTAITPTKFARAPRRTPTPRRIARGGSPLARGGSPPRCAAMPLRTSHPRAPLVRLGGRARCPHRAAAPSARCAT